MPNLIKRFGIGEHLAIFIKTIYHGNIQRRNGHAGTERKLDVAYFLRWYKGRKLDVEKLLKSIDLVSADVNETKVVIRDEIRTVERLDPWANEITTT